MVMMPLAPVRVFRDYQGRLWLTIGEHFAGWVLLRRGVLAYGRKW